MKIVRNMVIKNAYQNLNRKRDRSTVFMLSINLTLIKFINCNLIFAGT